VETYTEEPTSPYYLLKDINQRLFFKRLSPYDRLDACLMALSVMSYLLSKRSDLISLIEVMLRQNINFF
jgi:hypothetical protein